SSWRVRCEVSSPPLPSSSLTRWPPPRPTLFPYTTLFRSELGGLARISHGGHGIPPAPGTLAAWPRPCPVRTAQPGRPGAAADHRSEEHTSELQSRFDLVCRLLLEKKKTPTTERPHSHTQR